MDDGHLLVVTQGRLATTQDALGKSLAVTEFLIKVVIIAASTVTIIHIRHHAAVARNGSATLTLLVTDGSGIRAAVVIMTTARTLVTAAVVIKAATRTVTMVVTTLTARTAGTAIITRLDLARLIVALTALTGAETLVADVLSTLAHLVIATVKNDILQQLTIQSAVIELVAHRRLQAHLVVQLLVKADEPHVVALESVLELVTQVAVQLLDVLHVQTLAVGRVADQGATGWHLVDVVDVTALEFDILVQTGILHIGTGDGDGLALDVTAVDLVSELALGTVIVVNLVKQLGVVVGPLLESKTVAVHTGSDVGSDERCLDQERARTAHGVNQVGFTLPTAQQDDAGGQHLVDGCIGLRHTPASLEQRLSTAVQRQGHIAARDVHIKTDFGIVEANAGALAVLLVEKVGNRVLDTIGDKSGVVEVLTIDGGINGKRRLHCHQLFPVKGLELLIQVVGSVRAQRQEGFEHTHRSAAGKIRPVEHFLVSLEVNHAVTLGNIVCA